MSSTSQAARVVFGGALQGYQVISSVLHASVVAVARCDHGECAVYRRAVGGKRYNGADAVYTPWRASLGGEALAWCAERGSLVG
ncbi:hypothetical protein [Sorangium sp. So ce233]|uniref:hypothetical protein n=1 Tax=Sorangium sp. So ce233 TaxID=3133290 RepID=UPI003F5EC6CD